MITAFTASTFFPKHLSRAGKRVKASMQKPFYHAFTTFTDTLQIDAYSNRFHLPPEHITRYPVITRCSHINRLHTFTYIFQFTFFQQSPEMTIRRSPCHAAYFLKIITKHYIMIDKIFLQPHIYLYLRQGFRMACILAPADFSTYQLPPQTGIKENPNCIDSTGALSLEKLPKSMVVIGGGVIGLELACAYAAFGTKITVVEAMDHMLPMLDGDLTKIGVAHMKKMGMEFHLECPVQSVETSPVGAKVVCKDKTGKTVAFEAEKVLVAIGRRANTASLDLEAGELDNDRGRILVNEKMETSVPGVYAIGDCVFGHAQLAHTASAMGEVAAENIMGIPAVYDERTNPTCVYIEPEAASVGLTEEQCKAQGIDYKVGKFPMAANGKALILNGGEGIVKIIAGKQYGEILGMHIIGPRATDLIAEGALAIAEEMTLDEIISTIHSHPTVTETMREAALQAEGRAIHTSNR